MPRTPRHFSWMLALRYLNPLRLHMSAITLILLIGVSLGVMVMIVVLSVMAGFEREIKKRILGFTPHVQVVEMAGGMVSGVSDWRNREKELASMEGVISAYATIDDHVLMESRGYRAPKTFRAINTDDANQIKALTDLLDLKNHPASRADMGYDKVAVVSSLLANDLAIGVGDTIRLYASRSFDDVFTAYDSIEEDLLTTRFKETFQSSLELLEQQWEVKADAEVIPLAALQEAYNPLFELYQTEKMRNVEKEELSSFLQGLEEGEKDEDAGLYRFAQGAKVANLFNLQQLMEMNRETADNDTLRALQEVVLPQDIEVIGVYKGSQHAPGPGLFIPLQTGQELTGYADGEQDLVQSIALRVENPYRADLPAQRILKQLGEGWGVQTWMVQHQDRFNLIQMERAMMSFALSFIMLIAGFSIGAVMYTVTTQKKQEIGVMKALGASPWQIIKVFLYQGLIVGLGGGLLGVGLGLLVVRFRGQIQLLLDGIGLNPFPPGFHGMDVIPARVVPFDVSIIFVGAVLMCCFAAFVPALMAARRDAAKSLRNF